MNLSASGGSARRRCEGRRRPPPLRARMTEIPSCSEDEHMRCRSLILAVLVILLAGCSSEPYQVAPVSGRITLDGKPVEKVAVMFQPVASEGNINPGPGSYGITDADGRYTLKLIGVERPGAAMGHHKV